MSVSMPRWLVAVLAVIVTALVWFTLTKVTGRANLFSSGLVLPCGDPAQGNISSNEQAREMEKKGDVVYVMCTHGHYFMFKNDHWESTKVQSQFIRAPQ